MFPLSITQNGTPTNSVHLINFCIHRQNNSRVYE